MNRHKSREPKSIWGSNILTNRTIKVTEGQLEEKIVPDKL